MQRVTLPDGMTVRRRGKKQPVKPASRTMPVAKPVEKKTKAPVVRLSRRPFFGSTAIDNRVQQLRLEGVAAAGNELAMPAFPIDFVFTYVQDTPRLRAERLAYMKNATGDVSDNESNRYESHCELQFALRGVVMHLPWVRHVFLVIGDHEDQHPTFLDKNQQIRSMVYRLSPTIEMRVIKHSQIFRGSFAADLPTYNSHAIESHLHEIPGLSDAFIASNDDFFVSEPMPYTAFFTIDSWARGGGTADGQSVPVISQNHFTSGILPVEKSPNMHKHGVAWVNNISTLRRMFPSEMKGARLRYQSHSPVPLFKSSMIELWRHPLTQPLLCRTSRAKVRSSTDLYFLGFLMYFNLFTLRGRPAELHTTYLQLRTGMNFKLVAKRIVKQKPSTFCLNDSFSGQGRASAFLAFSVNQFLQRYFPVVLSCERK